MSNDLIAAIAKRNQALAQPQAAVYADANRLFCVLIVRPQPEPSFNRGAGAFVPQVPQQVYEGPARITPVDPGAQTDIGDGPVYWSNVTVSIGLGAQLDPMIDDLITITADSAGNLARIGDKQFRTVGVALGGHMATGFLLTGSGVVPSRNTHPGP